MGNLFFDEPGVKVLPDRPYRKGDVIRWKSDSDIHYLVTEAYDGVTGLHGVTMQNVDILRIASDRPDVAPTNEKLLRWPIYDRSMIRLIAEDQEIPNG